MDIKAFSQLLRNQGFMVFSPHDIKILWPGGNRQVLALQLHQWAAKGWLRRLKRGLYELAYPERLPLPDYYLANQLYEPSYVSLETALSHYQLLPETAFQVTSVTTKPTRRFKNDHGLFTYFTIQQRAFTGYALVPMQGYMARVAEPEKALVDLLYARLRRGETSRLTQERWDRAGLRRMNRKKLKAYTRAFGPSCKKLEAYIHALLR